MNKHDGYQDTGIEWVGKIPREWDLIRGKYLFLSIKEINKDLQCKNLLSLTYDGVLNKDYESSKGLRPENYNTYQIFKKNDLVFKMIDLENVKTSRVGIVHEDGIMSSAYIRQEPIKEKIDSKFAYWFYYDLYKKEIYNSIGSGVRSTLSSSDLLEIELPTPPLKEQKLISRYLYKKTAQVDSLIEKIQKIVELLKKQRTSLINKYVTKGLDPNVEMKDSGFEWIGEIPRHWEIIRLKYLFTLVGGKGPKNIQCDDGPYPILGSGGEIDRGKDFLYDKKTLLLGRKGTVDRPFIFNGPFWVSDVMYFTIKKTQMTPDYLLYLFTTFPFKKYVYGSTQPSMSRLDYENHFFPVPPFEEQKTNLEYLNEKDRLFQKSLTIHKKRIELLEEFKQSLVSETVTGKKRITTDMV